MGVLVFGANGLEFQGVRAKGASYACQEQSDKKGAHRVTTLRLATVFKLQVTVSGLNALPVLHISS